MRELREKYIYYVIICILTLVAIIFLPLIGLDPEGQINLNTPDSTIGWIIWGVSKGCICLINCLIFHLFVRQGKINIKDDPRYINGLKALNKYKDKTKKVPSPFKLEAHAYMKKGGMVLLTTVLSLFALPSLVLQFSLINFLSVLFSMIIALSFGVIAMKDTEVRWTEQLEEYVEFLAEEARNDKKTMGEN